jgi:hypothetical protein
MNAFKLARVVKQEAASLLLAAERTHAAESEKLRVRGRTVAMVANAIRARGS